jgi:hypothetical protein
MICLTSQTGEAYLGVGAVMVRSRHSGLQLVAGPPYRLPRWDYRSMPEANPDRLRLGSQLAGFGGSGLSAGCRARQGTPHECGGAANTDRDCDINLGANHMESPLQQHGSRRG